VLIQELIWTDKTGQTVMNTKKKWTKLAYFATFDKLRSDNNDTTVLLPNHPPEVDDGLL